MTAWQAHELVECSRYPIDALESVETKDLAESCRRALEGEGACVLRNFLRPDAIEAMLGELEPLYAEAYYCRQDHNAYLDEDDPAYPPSHPRNRAQVSDKGCLADDQIPRRALLRRLYDWEALRGFIAAVLGVPRLYPYADPLGSLNLNIFAPGQQLGWHFDNADFAVTLLLQSAEAGGVYEYVPGLRSPEGADDFEALSAILDGGRRNLRWLAMGPGALVLFRGRHALHRVTPVEGSRPRVLAVLSFDTRPGKRLTAHTQRLFYGRAA
ncbi:MAG: 2OG-Fe(II) oxygenase [Kiloniellales bacterium]|nr:2OG-Fe(II) oxygenase [Kiloniellales bacterium]